MSIKAINWAKKQRTRNTGCQCILYILADGADENGKVHRSLTTKRIAELTRLSLRAAQEHLRELAEDYCIARDRRHDANGYRIGDGIELRLAAKSSIRPSGRKRHAYRKKTTCLAADSAAQDSVSLRLSPESSYEDSPRARAKRRSTRNQGSAIPDDFQPDAASTRFALSLGFDPADMPELVREFMDYWRAVPGAKALKADWQATFRNSCKRQRRWKEERDEQRPRTLKDTVTRAAESFLRRKGIEPVGVGDDDENPRRPPRLEAKQRHH